jgi:hypothetical protein
MGWLKVLEGNEEEKFFWHPDVPEEVRQAREKFVRYQRQGFLACKIMGQGETGVQISEFDGQAEEIFMLGIVDGG